MVFLLTNLLANQETEVQRYHPPLRTRRQLKLSRPIQNFIFYLMLSDQRHSFSFCEKFKYQNIQV